MRKKKMETKDLITTGIFTAIYFVLFFVSGMIGYIPALFVLIPFILPVVGGIPFMLFLTKVKCFGMVTIMGTILGMLMVLTGHTYIPLITGLIFGLLADLLFMAGKYQSKKLSIVGYSIFSLWILGMLVPFWVMRDAYEKQMMDSMGMKYAQTVMGIFEKISWAFPIMIILGGLIGAFVGLSMLKKHFKKAGIA
ncbi:MptD family putative ECF transporter S component [Paraliobacillus sp. JSM ZJ581]|uniref:MptD family putative ECF transporter S component n=1 Tax=Paraliobacillus sp. JSM ZJ581 TaxID=3342118 RepID=UPI0035A81EEC